jgi:hypothetical protein
VIKREPKCDIGPTIMSDKGEPIMAERAHNSRQIVRYGALGVRRVIGSRSRPALATVTAHVRTHNREPAIHELGAKPMPRGRSSWVAMHQKHRSADATMPHVDRCFSNVNAISLEA